MAKVLFTRLRLPVRGDLDPADRRGDRGDGAGAPPEGRRAVDARPGSSEADARRRPTRRCREDADRLLPDPVGRAVHDRDRRRAGPPERADHLHVDRAPAERGEPRAGRLLARSSASSTARCWRSSRWWSRPPRSSSVWRSSCRSSGDAGPSNVDDARGSLLKLAAAGGRRPDLAGLADPRAAARRRGGPPVRSAERLGQGCRRARVAPRWPARSSSRVVACLRTCSACREDERVVVQHLFDWISVGSLPRRRSISGSTRCRHDDPGRHRASAFLIHVYSIDYMHGDPRYARFFAYLNLFVFFMLMLVLANNFVLLYVGWEGVGLCSYLLIALLVRRRPRRRRGEEGVHRHHRIGDTAMLIGIFLIVRDVRHRSTSTRSSARRADDRRGDRDGDRAAAVRRRDRQVRAAPAARLAARRDGGSDAGLRADPRRDDGHRRRVPGRADARRSSRLSRRRADRRRDRRARHGAATRRRARSRRTT